MGSLLISSLPTSHPSIVLDLGSGDGALTAAAVKIWSAAHYYTVDIDSDANSGQLRKLYGGSFTHHVGDALEVNIGERLGLKPATADIAICNPPYIRRRWKKSFGAILEEAGLSGILPRIRDVPADILFIAQNLRYLKNNGRLGIIVPDGLVSGENCTNFRRKLATTHSIEKVIELPRNIFSKTDAKAHIVILAKNLTGPADIQVQQLMLNGALSEPLFVSQEKAAHRLDYSYLCERSLKASTSMMTIRDVANELRRGTISSAQRRQVTFPVVHTSDITPQLNSIGRDFAIAEKALADLRGPIANRGDILLARVGRNLEEKVCRVSSNNVVVSDCVFILKVKRKYQAELLAYLRSTIGRQALKAIAHGVGARFLTSEAILEIPFRKKNGD